MGFRFHKRIRLAKGVYWELSKKGSSLPIGGHDKIVLIVVQLRPAAGALRAGPAAAYLGAGGRRFKSCRP
jgi:hypothetical protein